MSLYQMINGVNPATFFILPMLGERRPESYPRFRDCFVNKREWDNSGELPRMKIANQEEVPKNIYVYTRVGGGNREEYALDIIALQSHPNYITDFDDSFDSTYATFVFTVPDEFKSDYDHIVNGNLHLVSQTLRDRVYRLYPSIKEKLDVWFANPAVEDAPKPETP